MPNNLLQDPDRFRTWSFSSPNIQFFFSHSPRRASLSCNPLYDDFPWWMMSPSVLNRCYRLFVCWRRPVRVRGPAFAAVAQDRWFFVQQVPFASFFPLLITDEFQPCLFQGAKVSARWFPVHGFWIRKGLWEFENTNDVGFQFSMPSLSGFACIIYVFFHSVAWRKLELDGKTRAAEGLRIERLVMGESYRPTKKKLKAQEDKMFQPEDSTA